MSRLTASVPHLHNCQTKFQLLIKNGKSSPVTQRTTYVRQRWMSVLPQVQNQPQGQFGCALAPRQPLRSRRRNAGQADEAAGAADALGPVPEGGRAVVVELPADIRTGYVDAGGLVRAAWAPSVALLIADMALVECWDARALSGLLDAHCYLASRGVDVRLVVWSRQLSQAVQMSTTGPKLPIYASVIAALRPHP